MSKLQDLKTEFISMKNFPIIEIYAEHRATKELEYVNFDIMLNLDEDAFLVQYPSMSRKEQQSEKISSFEIEMDDSFTLDEHLNLIYAKAYDIVNESEFYFVPDEE